MTMNLEHPSERPDRHQHQVDQLVRSLLALPDLTMRLSWLKDRVPKTEAKALAPVLDQLADRAQGTDPRAREAMMAITLFFSQKRDSSHVWALREEANKNALLSLEGLLREKSEGEPETPDIELEPRVPDYGKSRELTVGERKSLARRPTRLQIDKLLLDPHPLVLEQLFQCPGLTEEDVVRIATRRPARLVALELLSDSARWMARRRVRLSLILNPGTPHGLSMPLVSSCSREDLALIIGTTTVSRTLRSVAHELHSKLPPVATTTETHRHH